MAVVRIFTWAGLVMAPVFGAGRPTSDTLLLLKQRYLGRETLAPTTSVAATSAAATAPLETKLVQVQVDPGKRVHYEVTPNGYTLVPATTDSPLISGSEIIQFDAGWQISFLEATT